jgi:pyridoxine 4-dehydrogenase
MTEGELTAAASGVFAIGRNVAVTRLGLGTIRLANRGYRDEPAHRETAIRVLRRAVELGVDLIDTAGSRGSLPVEELIREALHPYQGVTVATKGGLARAGSGQPEGAARPEDLRQQVELSLRRLGLDVIELYQLQGFGTQVPAADQIGVLGELRAEGKIRHIGLCQVGVDDISEARLTAPIASVANPYHLADRGAEPVLDYCEREGLGFIACSSLGPAGAGPRSAIPLPLAQLARQTGTSPAQLALAWLLRQSPVVLPVPGTGLVAHLEENVAAAELELSDEQFRALSEVAAPGARL